jgi:hypothetical protein
MWCGDVQRFAAAVALDQALNHFGMALSSSISGFDFAGGSLHPRWISVCMSASF